MEKKIKLLFVLGSMHNGGTEVFVMNYFREIEKTKFDIDFLLVQGNEEYFKNEIETSGSHIYHLSNTNGGKYYKNIGKISNFFSEHEYDIIHIHSCSLRFLVLMAFFAKKKQTGIVIGHAHSVGEPTGSFVDYIARLIMKGMASHYLDYGMACSTDSAEGKYTKKFIQSNRYKMIPNAIDTKKYAFSDGIRRKIRNRYNLEDQFVIGIVGRLEKWKNQSFLIEATKIVQETADVYLMIVGDGDIRADLEKQAESLGLEDKVIFTGAVNNANEYYSAMDLFCLPSYAEGFPFVLVEAQANGLKCLISDTTTREVDISGTSIFLPIQDPKVWAENIVKNKNSRISPETIQRVKEKYDIHYSAKDLERYYIAVVQRKELK